MSAAWPSPPSACATASCRKSLTTPSRAKSRIATTPPPASSIAGTRSFARRLEYDQPHAEHVRELSILLFDRLQAAASPAAAIARTARSRSPASRHRPQRQPSRPSQARRISRAQRRHARPGRPRPRRRRRVSPLPQSQNRTRRPPRGLLLLVQRRQAHRPAAWPPSSASPKDSTTRTASASPIFTPHSSAAPSASRSKPAATPPKTSATPPAAPTSSKKNSTSASISANPPNDADRMSA